MTKYKNPYNNLPDVYFASSVFDEDDQAASQHYFDVAKASAEYDAALSLMLDERQYNSYEEKIKRARVAGLNPDLMNISEGDSGTMNPVTMNPHPVNSGSNQTNAALSMSQAFLQAVPEAVSLVQSIKQTSQQLQMNEFELIGKADSLARMEIGRQLTLDDLNDKTSFPVVDLSHYSKRTARQVDKALSRYIYDVNNRESAKGFVYDNKSQGQKLRQGYLDIISQAGFSLDDETFLGVLKEYNEIVRKSLKNQSKYQSDYYGTIDGTQQANTENSQYQKQAMEAENDALEQLMARANELIDSDKTGDKMKGFLLYAITSIVSNLRGNVSMGNKKYKANIGL